MGLKQSIVVVNEYTVKSKRTGKGSRGGSPGNYVLRYMARKGAVEDVTPVRLFDSDGYILKYMARKDATEKAVIKDERPEAVSDKMEAVSGLGGIGFGRDDISFSDEAIHKKAKKIQNAYDKGKTVLKTVLSFDMDYLKERNIVPKDFEIEKEGDLKGHVDQMKLRMAIRHGMKRMSRTFSDLDWVGTIQMDTMHLHCHLCMVDMGKGTLAKDGTQKGKLSDNQMRSLRRGIDLSLDETSPVKYMSSQITKDKMNAKSFVKKFTHELFERNATPQFLLACLPENKNYWRADTNRQDMKKANAIVKEYVEALFEEPSSGYASALSDIQAYADHRQKEENLNPKEYRQLIDRGKTRLLHDCMNGVYSVLANIPQAEKTVRTPMLDIMSQDYEEVYKKAKDDPIHEFGFKLRSYATRLNHHKKETHKYREARMSYEKAKEDGLADDASLPLYQFYKFEEEYNAKLMAKYQHFLAFLPPEKEYEKEFKELLDYKKALYLMNQMKEDKGMRRMKEDNAEAHGLSVYGQHGGRFAVIDPLVLEERHAKMQETYERKKDAFRMHLADYGLSLSEKEGNLAVKKENPYAFSDVKSLDIHHLLYDFSYDFSIAKHNVDSFVEAAKERTEKLADAVSYLKATDQDFYLKDLPLKDCLRMGQLADRLSSNPVLPFVEITGDSKKTQKTFRLDANYQKEVRQMIRMILESEKEAGDF